MAVFLHLGANVSEVSNNLLKSGLHKMKVKMTTNTMFNSYVFLFFSESFPNIWLLFIGMDWFKESRTIWQTISIMFKMLILTAY